MSKRSRGFCFTVNNYDEDDFIWVSELYVYDINCQYLIIGFEEGRNGTPHLQCYIYYNEKVSWSVFKKRVYSNHFEVQKAKDNVKAYCYCMEEGLYIEFGERPRQGHRTDLEVIKYDILNGKSDRDIAYDNFSQWCQYRRAFTEFRKLNEEKYDTELYVFEDEEIPLIYKNYPSVSENSDAIDYLCLDMKTKTQYRVMYYSKKYRRIFIPFFYSDEWSKNISLPIVDDEKEQLQKKPGEAL